jgi:hypothetical protein
MAGSVDLFLNISNGLDENLKKSEKSLSGMNDVAGKVNKNMSEMNKSSSMLNDNYDDIVENSEKAAKSTDKLSAALSKGVGFAKKLGSAMLVGFGALSLIDIVQATFKLNQEMSDLSFRMGESGKSAKELEGAVTGVTLATGASIDASMEWITGLREMRVATEDLQELATAGYRFSEVTGASEANTRTLIGSLNTMGGLGTKAIKGMLKEMVAVQRAFGLAAAEMDNLTNSITKSSQLLRSMGKSAGEVTKFSSGVSKLAGAFASVGLNAEVATGFIEKLLDPGAIEDNALLYSKLGISIGDAMEGNVDPAKLIGGFKDLGKELKGMSNFAANELAKSLGMPLNELRQMSEMDENELNKALGGTLEISEDLKKEQEAQALAQKDFAAASEKLKSVFIDIALKAMPTINKLTGWVADNIEGWIEGGKVFITKIGDFFKKFTGGDLKKIGLILAAAVVGVIFLFTRMRKKFASVSTDMGKDLSEALSTGMSEAMDMSSEKAATKFEERMKSGTSAYMEDLQARIIEGTDYAATQAASNFYKTMGGTKLTKGAAALANHAGEYLDKISAGAKPASLLERIASKSNDRTKERIKLENESSAIQESAIKGRKSLAEADEKRFTDRINQLAEEKTISGSLAPAREKELKKLAKLQAKSIDARKADENKLKVLTAKNNDRELSALKNLSKEERVRMKTAIEDEIKKGNEEKKNNERFQANNQTTLDGLQNSREQLDAEMMLIDKKLATEKLTSQQVIELNSQRLIGTEQQKETQKLMEIELEERTRLAGIEKDIDDSLEKNNRQLMIMINSGANLTKDDLDRMNIHKEDLITQATTLDKQSQGYKNIQKELREIEKLTEGSLAGVDGEVLVKTFGEKIKGTFEAVKNNFVGGVKDGINVAKDSLAIAFKSGLEIINPKNWRKAISAAGDGSFFKGLGKVLKKGAGKIGGAVSKGAKGVGKAFGKMGRGFKSMGGPLMLLAGVFIGLLKNTDEFKTIMAKVQEVFKKLMAKIMPILSKLMAAIMPLIDTLLAKLMPVIDLLAEIFIKDVLPIIMDLIDAFMPLVDILFDVLGPVLKILGEIFKAMMPLFISLVNALLPPLLTVLGNVVKVIGFLIGKFADLMLFLADLGAKATDDEKERIQRVRDFGKLYTNIGDTLIKAADAIKNPDVDDTPLTEKELMRNSEKYDRKQLTELEKQTENTDPQSETVTTTLYPAIIAATSSGFVKTEDAKKTMSGSPEAMEKLAKEQLEVDKRRNELLEENNSLNAVTATATAEMKDKPLTTPQPSSLGG